MSRNFVLVLLATCTNLITSLLGCGVNIFLTDQNQTSHFTSPNFGDNKLYPLNVFCQWNIISPNTSTILLEFSHFDVELHSDCIWDYVHIYDGACGIPGNIEGNKYCGATLPSNFTSASNKLCVEFRSDVIVAKSGFNTKVHLINQSGDAVPVILKAPCSSSPFIVNTSSIIMTPNYGPQSFYPNNRVCQWLVNPINQVVKVVFESFDVEYHGSCGYDSLKIFNGSSTSSIVGNMFCGSTIPQTLYIQHTSLFVFTSDVVVPRHGFKATLTFLPSTENTSADLLPSGLLSSTVQPSSVASTDYLSSAVTKESKSSSSITSSAITELTPSSVFIESTTYNPVTEINLKSASETKSSVNESPNPPSSVSIESSSIESTESLLSSSSVSTTSSIWTSTSSTSDVINKNITPTSSSSTTVFTVKEVVQDTYDICSRTSLSITDPVNIVSPNYGPSQLYPLNVDCQLSIQNKHNKVMKLSILEADIEYHPQCSWDSLVIYDGNITDSSKHLATICSNNPFSFNSTESSVTLHFISDQIIAKTGFKVLIEPGSNDVSASTISISTSSSTEPKETKMTSDLKLFSQSVESTKIPTMFSTSLHTASTLIVSSETVSNQPSNSLVLDKTGETELATMPSLASQSPIQQLSQSSTITPEPQTSQSQFTLLTSVLQSTTTPKSTTYSQPEINNTSTSSPPSNHLTSDLVDICQHQYMYIAKPYHIVSPNFGQNRMYPLNKNCSLLLESSSGGKVQLDFDFFELEYHSQCVWDYLAIYDGNSSSSLLSKICGTRENDTFSSTGSQLLFQFRSDIVIPKRGFSVHVTVNETNMITSTTTETTSMPSSTSSSTSKTYTTHPTTGAVTSSTLPPSTTGAVPSSTIPPSTTGAVTSSAIPPSTTGAVTSSTIPPSTTGAVTSSAIPPSTTGAVTSSTIQPSTGAVTSSAIPPSTTGSVTSSTIPPSTTIDLIATACSGAPMILTSLSGLIASPGFYKEKKYDNNLDCLWVIQAPLNKIIQISFRSMDIEYQETCGWDKLSIYDGSSLTDSVIGNYCGKVLPNNITSTSNNLLIKFKTDRLIGWTGFELSFALLDSQNDTVTCPMNLVPCTNGVCIPQEWLCDGEADCDDGMDENVCELCDADEFRCHSGKCLPQYQNCDGIAHCSDAEDEDGCIKVSNMSRLMVMSSGKWFPVCENGTDAAFALEMCRSMAFPGMVSFGSLQSPESKTFAVYKQVKSLFNTNGHSNFILSTACPSGKTVTLSCKERVCGMKANDLPQPFVVGGSQSLKGEWPWMAAILSGTNYICGGTIIADQWVVTAGHCVQDISHSPHTTSIRVGSPSLKDEEAKIYRVSEMLMNPEYNFIYKADIALIRLQKPIAFNSNIRPICLPTRIHNWSPSLPCYVSGWGVNHPQNAILKITSDDLHHGKVKLWSQSKCQAVYPGKIKDFMICAGYEMGIIDACQGDSGGPLMCETGEDNWEFVGVTSWGEGCGEINKPGVYTRVDHYLDWIKSTTESTASKASCDFEKPTICGYSDESNSALMWTRRSGGSYYHSRPLTDVSFNNKSGNYMYAYIPYEGRDKTASLLSPRLNLTNDGCLTFWFHFYGGVDATLKVLGESKTNSSLNQLAKFWTITPTWISTEVDLTPGLKRLVFVVNAGKKVDGGIAIDEVKVNNSHCKGLAKLSCNFDSGTFCYYQNAADNSGDWQIKLNLLNKVDARSSNPGQDHYLEVDGEKQVPDTRTKLLSPELNSTVSKCLSFRYRIYPAYSMTLSVCTITETNGKSFSNCHWSRSTSNNNSWTQASAQVPRVIGVFRIGIQAHRKYLPGVVNIDEIRRRDGNC